MLDFTSALYLGLLHPSASLAAVGRAHARAPGRRVSRPCGSSRRRARAPSGMRGGGPAALDAASLLGSVSGARSRSNGDPVDTGLYPIARWGAERAAGLGIPVQRFPHHDAAALERWSNAWRRRSCADHRHRRLLPGLRDAGTDPGLCRDRAAWRAASSSSTTRRPWGSSARRRAVRNPMARAVAARCAGTAFSGRTSSSAARSPRLSAHRLQPCSAAAR